MNLNKLMGGKRKINDKKERLVDVIVIYKDGDKREETLDYYPYELDKIFNFFTYHSFMDLIKEIKVRTGGQFWTTIFKDGHVHYDIYDDENGWQTIDYDFVPEKGKSSYDYEPRGGVSDSRRVKDNAGGVYSFCLIPTGERFNREKLDFVEYGNEFYNDYDACYEDAIEGAKDCYRSYKKGYSDLQYVMIEMDCSSDETLSDVEECGVYYVYPTDENESDWVVKPL